MVSRAPWPFLQAFLLPVPRPLSSGGTGASTLTVSTTVATVPALYTVTISGVSGSIRNSTSLVLTVTPPAGFEISTSQTNLTVLAGASDSSIIITVVGFNGFSGTVALTNTISPSGPGTSFNPPSVTVSPSSSGTS